MIVSFIGWPRSLGFGYDIAFTILICPAKQQKQSKSLERSEKTTRTEETDGNKGRYVRDSPLIHSVTNFFGLRHVDQFSRSNKCGFAYSLSATPVKYLGKSGGDGKKGKIYRPLKKQEFKKKTDKKFRVEKDEAQTSLNSSVPPKIL